jgi:hypothetical protein
MGLPQIQRLPGVQVLGMEMRLVRPALGVAQELERLFMLAALAVLAGLL